MLPPDGALLAHLSLAAVCWTAARLVALAAGPSPAVARRLRRVGAFLALLAAAGAGTLAGTDAHVAAWTGTALPGLPADAYPTLGALALFCGPVPLAAYAAYRGGDAGLTGAPGSASGGSAAGFLRGYALAVGPALLVTALSPAIPDGWWLVVGVASVGLLVAAGTPLFVRWTVPSRPLSPGVPVPTDLPVYVLRTGRDGPANALAAGVLPGLRCVFVTERLVGTLPDGELAAIVTHEVAHHRRHHVALRLGAVAAFVLPWLGATALSVPGAFLAGLALALPVSVGIFRLVRWTEYDADAYAAGRVGAGAMRDALRRLGGPTASGPSGPSGPGRGPGRGLFATFALHPPLRTRIARLDAADTTGTDGSAMREVGADD